MHTTGKNLLLINPWIYDFAAYDLWSQPLGLLYIASFLRSYGFNISYIDCLRSENETGKTKRGKYGNGNYRREIVEKPEILANIPRKYARYGIPEKDFISIIDQIPSPDAVLITTMMTYWYPGPQNVVRLIRAKFPRVPVIIGGVYATLMPEHAQTAIQPDHIIEGPGEGKVLKLLIDLFNLPPESEFKEDDLDTYPYPAFDLIPNRRYLCVISARGCPLNCSFCAQRQIAMKFTQRDPKKVVKEIIDHYQKFKIRDFAFYDDALFINKEIHIKVILRHIIESRLPLRFHTPNGLFAGDIDEELAQLMYRGNFKTIRLSFETSNEDRRRDMSNKISNEGMRLAVKNLVKAGYPSKAIESYVIMGLPDQTLDEVLESIIFVNDLGVQVRMASYSPIPGTLDYRRAVESGAITGDIDPLLTNKTIFPLKSSEDDYESFRKIRIFSQILNEAAQKNFAPFADNSIGKSLNRILRGKR